MNDEERRHIVEHVLEAVIKEWKDTSVAALKEQDGTYFFTFTFKHSAFLINAQGMIEDVLMELYHRDLAANGALIDAGRAILNQDLYYTTTRVLFFMLNRLPHLLQESNSLLFEIAVLNDLKATTAPFLEDEANYLGMTAIAKFENTMRGYLNLPRVPLNGSKRSADKPGRSPAINDAEAFRALQRLGWHTSVNKLAQALNRPRSTVRAWIQRRGYKSLGEMVEKYHQSCICQQS